MKVVIIKNMSAGNESVGEMWNETKIFQGKDTLEDVLKWAQNDYEVEQKLPTKKNIMITVPAGQDDEQN